MAAKVSDLIFTYDHNAGFELGVTHSLSTGNITNFTSSMLF